MTTINDAKKTVYNTFIAGWTAETAPFTFDNESFSPPVTEWVRLVVRNTNSNQETLGQKTARRFLRQASVLIQIFTVANTGTKEADRLADVAKNIFEGERIGNIWFLEADVRETGTDGEWYQVVVEIIFNYEETK